MLAFPPSAGLLPSPELEDDSIAAGAADHNQEGHARGESDPRTATWD